MILNIDPKVDYAFKHLFGRDATRPILIDLLNQVLNGTGKRLIREVELLNPFNPKETFDDKLSILDIKARDESGRQINVEMQMLPHPYFKSRILYYLAKFHQQQLREGEKYSALRPSISIVFLNRVLFPEVADYHLRFRLLEERHRLLFADDLEVHILELPKFQKSDVELLDGLDIWIYFLRHAAKIDSDALPKALDYPLLLRALEELKMISKSDVERERYEARRKAQLDYDTGMEAARMEGISEGRTEGLVRGEKIGAIRTYERLLQRLETPPEQLMFLSMEELARLAEDLDNQLRNSK
jgi:predicted transposase/invertase (TIGR01784 family)